MSRALFHFRHFSILCFHIIDKLLGTVVSIPKSVVNSAVSFCTLGDSICMRQGIVVAGRARHCMNTRIRCDPHGTQDSADS
ncbi:hypothetical protein IQ06DRAFT_82675 [Phaeosphaeriaceae sp. SRC1lsM3a]|nr:hypothetical protein IQ06DRAFT_82675 [Stagonospora sp. SRC1lsM3a]